MLAVTVCCPSAAVLPRTSTSLLHTPPPCMPSPPANSLYASSLWHSAQCMSCKCHRYDMTRAVRWAGRTARRSAEAPAQGQERVTGKCTGRQCGQPQAHTGLRRNSQQHDGRSLQF